MAKQGAALQTYNSELVKMLGELSDRRKSLQEEIDRDEEEQARLRSEADRIGRQLDKVEASLAAKLEKRDGYDRTIAESERAFMQILESSQTLLSHVRSKAKTLETKEDKKK